MFVIKRDGSKESVKFDKITSRIENILKSMSNNSIDATIITQKICNRIYPGITTTELDNLASQVCMNMITDHPDYGVLGSQIVISNHQKNTSDSFLEVVKKLRNNKDINENLAPLVSEELLYIAEKYEKEINDIIDYEREYLIDFFGFKTLEKSYLLKVNKKVVERPSHLFMRVAIGIHGDDLKNVKKTYNNMSLKNYTHATPTLFNAGTPRPQLSSCFLTATEDSIEGIFETITDCAKISKWAGGIGIHISNIRANGSYIRKTGGSSDGIMPMLKVYNDTARYINQCILPDVKVYSQNGIKRMDEVLLDDFLITKDGSYKKVNKIFINDKNEEILEITTSASLNPLKCTKNHEIYRIQPTTKRSSFVRIKRQIEINSVKREFVLADNIKINDYLGYPIPTFEKDMKNWNIDICRLYGLMLGDGNITKSKTSTRYQITLNNTTKIDSFNFVLDLLNRLDIHYWISNDYEICWTYNINSILKIGIKQEDLYDSNMMKRCIPEILHLPKNKLAMVIKGLLDSDGGVTKTGIYFVNTSKNLIESLTYMLLRFHILTTVKIINNVGKIMGKNKRGKDIICKKISYSLRIPKIDILKTNNIFHNFKTTTQRNYFEYDGILYSRVKKIEYKNYTGKVYDFNMTDNHNYLTTSGLVHNSGKRNGSFAMYIEPWHADIYSFLDAKKNHGAEEERARDLFYALWIPDLFMRSVENDENWYLMCPDKCPGLPDVYGEDFDNLYNKYVIENKYNKKIKARDLWQAIIGSQVETGTPYMLYKDSANKKSNQKNIGTIKSSNLCVSGDTMILTKEGYYPIKNLENLNIEVWNGKNWSKTEVKKTGENQKLLNIKFSNGMELKCTEYHKFYIETSSRPAEKSKPKIIEAKNLEKNMKIIRYDLELSNDNNNELKYAYTHGLYCADGTKSKFDTKYRCSYKRQKDKYFCRRHFSHIKDYDIDDGICCANSYSDKPLLSLYGEKIKLLEYIDKISYGEYINSEDKITISLPYDIDKKYYVPINNSINSKIRWLEGYFDGDSCIVENNGIKNIQYTSSNLEFMKNILLLLQTLGITSQIKVGRKEGKSLLPDGNGGKKYYSTKTVYRSSIDSISLNKLIKLGFNPKRLNISNNRLPHHITNIFIKIEDVKDTNLYEDTFCFNEPLEHKGIFNGIITGQCAEIVEVSNNEETAVCNLASICLQNVLEYPCVKDFSPSYYRWIKLLNDKENELFNILKHGAIKIFTTEECTYCKLLKSLLKKIGLTYTEINKEEAEKMRIMSEPTFLTVKPFETVPQLFVDDGSTFIHYGGYDDCWELLKPRINFMKLKNLAGDLTINLNKIIDKNFYPLEKTRVSNMNHRPIGIGVQGLADLFILLRLPFDSPQSMKLNKEIFETIYYGAMESSIKLAIENGKYSSFEGSPLSEGLFQFNLWGLKDEELSGKWDWSAKREEVVKYGARNSLLIALMPTASTSQIMNSNECFEPYTSNIYTRRTLAGEFTIVNKYLMQDLIDLDMWNEDTKDRLIYDKGSVKNIKNLPKFMKDIYKTVWEVSQKNLITMSADRAPFVCQSQSLNLFFEQPNFKTLTMAHMIGWKNGLKTGSYYIRSKPAVSSQRFGFDAVKEKNLKEEEEGCLTCSA